MRKYSCLKLASIVNRARKVACKPSISYLFMNPINNCDFSVLVLCTHVNMMFVMLL
jgi:hypothetical protein